MVENNHQIHPNIDRVLVIQTAFIGDVILTTPLLRAMKVAFPEASLDILVTPKTADLLIGNPYIDQTIRYDKRGEDKGILPFFRFVRTLRRHAYSLALLPHRSLRSALLVFFAGIPVRIGFDISAGSALYTKKVTYNTSIHEAKRNLELLSPFGMNSFDATPQIFLSQTEEQRAQEFLMMNGVDNGCPLVGMAPGSVWATKRWIPEGFAKVADKLRTIRDAQVILFGGSEDADLCQRISSMMKTSPILAAGHLSLRESAALIGRCNVFLSNDTGLMHLAAAIHVPVVVLFGATVPAFGFTPYGETHTVLEKDLPCRPCGIHGKKQCKEGTFACMKEIDPEDVYEALSRHV